MEKTIENQVEKCPFTGTCPQSARTRTGICRVGYEACRGHMEREENYIVLGEFEPLDRY